MTDWLVQILSKGRKRHRSNWNLNFISQWSPGAEQINILHQWRGSVDHCESLLPTPVNLDWALIRACLCFRVACGRTNTMTTLHRWFQTKIATFISLSVNLNGISIIQVDLGKRPKMLCIQRRCYWDPCVTRTSEMMGILEFNYLVGCLENHAIEFGTVRRWNSQM